MSDVKRNWKEFVIPELKCHRCNHVWKPRYNKRPGVCPVCKRTDWDGEEMVVVKSIVGGEE